MISRETPKPGRQRLFLTVVEMLTILLSDMFMVKIMHRGTVPIKCFSIKSPLQCLETPKFALMRLQRALALDRDSWPRIESTVFPGPIVSETNDIGDVMLLGGGSISGGLFNQGVK